MPPAFSPHRFGQYTLTARLGRGGMADVYRARREGAAGFERTVVVKKILSSHNEDPQFVDMFINEAKIAARLTHPNIVQVYELGEQDSEFYIVMEYVKGKDLLRLLRTLAQNKPESPAVPPLVAAYIARETARGLGHAHEHTDENGAQKPIVHRDVSPQNIMLSYDGQVKLVDFGIAKALDTMKEETRTGALKGKFAYMAPEQVGGHSPGPQSDIFAAGVVLHEMLTGRRLFKGASDYETLQKVQNMPVPSPSTVVKAVSPELDAIVLQALERDRKVRYSKASQMARDLDVFLQAHRFAVEDMAEYVKEVWPADAREDVPDGAMTSSYSIKPQEPTAPSSPRAIAGTPSAVRAERVEKEALAAAGRRRALVYGGAALLALAIAAIVVVPIARQKAAASKDEPRMVVEPMVHAEADKPLGGDKPLGSDRPIDRPLDARAEGDVRVVSEPPGAQVYAGPKLVGTAPVTLHLGRGGVAPVTLVHPGYEDLTYTVQSGDGPALTLRLLRKHKSTVAQPTTHDKAAPKKSKIDTFDDDKPHMPKVQAVDD
ncbi:MAG TPA: serine/threonine-protein kinase [Polyangia bacterium]|nr:serine/threonine-protein kinase [Polyangia bacterium]